MSVSYRPAPRPDQAARRKRWSEKGGVTKRAQTQKVSLARIPSLEGCREDQGHGARAVEADL